MGTSCTISVIDKKGHIEQIYANYDGYISYNGALLLLHYREPEKVKELVSLGNISALKKMVHPTSDTHNFNSPEKDVTVFYGRDRKEKGQNPSKFSNYEEFLQVGSFDDYNYLFDEKKGKWFFFNPNNKIIKDPLTMEAEVEKPKPLMKLVKAEFNKLNSDFKAEFLLYEKEIKAEKAYKKLKKELSKNDEPPKKLKI